MMRHGSVGCDGDEDAWVDHRAVRHLGGAGLVRRKGLARHHGRGQHQPSGDAETLEDAAPGDLLDADVALDGREFFRDL